MGRRRQGVSAGARRPGLQGRRGAQRAPARRRDTRCWSRPGPPKTAKTSPPGTPRPSSPHTRPAPTPGRSTSTSSNGRSGTAATPTPSRCCPASCRSSATPRRRRALEIELNRLIRPEYALPQLAELLGVDRTDLHLDAELPTDLPSEDHVEGAKSRRTLVVTLARRERLTVRELIARLCGGRGHFTVAGTPEQIADVITDWYQHRAADGFNIMPPVLPAGLASFVEQVVPILQERGLFRTEYAGRTLRDNYGLPRPANRSAAAAVQAVTVT